MNGIGGLVYEDAGRPMTKEAGGALLRGIGGRAELSDQAGVTLVAAGPATRLERLDDGTLACEIDLTNLEELMAATATPSPARALRALYAAEGPGFGRRLRGAFAIGLWLRAERRLVLAVDPFGLRRLYYAVHDGGLAFSSRALEPLTLPGTRKSLDRDAAYAYMNFGTVPAPQTMYQAVRRLPPGYALVWHQGRTSLEAYWDTSYPERPVERDEAARAIFRHTEEAVRESLTGADIKHTGAFLSGGTDSSTVVGLMRRTTGERVHAFSIGFQEERYDELSYARLAAAHYGAAHYSQLVTPADALACLPDLVAAYDEPFGNNSVIPTYLCARMARDTGIRLLLAGDGGDEIFGGNERYRNEYILSRYGLIPRPLRVAVIEPLLRALPAGGLSPLGKAQRYVERASLPNPERFYSSEFFVAQQRSSLLHPDFVAATTADWPAQVARRHYQTAATRSELNRLLYVDLKLTLADNDLFKVTRSAEVAGVQVRFPMLDIKLVELMGTLPAAYKVRGGEKRHLFKRAFAGFLPGEILSKVKHGFGLPISDWLKTYRPFQELARDTLLSARCRDRGYLAPGAMESLFALHSRDHTPFYGSVLWRFLMLELWHREHGDAR